MFGGKGNMTENHLQEYIPHSENNAWRAFDRKSFKNKQDRLFLNYNQNSIFKQHSHWF